MKSPCATVEAGGRVAAVVPAYNEERTVGEVVRVAVASGLFSEVIAVSDGSTDGTAAAARAAGATLVCDLPGNRGKGGAVMYGASQTTADVICLLDADLKGLRTEHLAALVEPVLAGRLCMSVGLIDRGPFWNALAARLPLISGERAMRRRVLESVPERYARGFGLEVALNYCCRANGWAFGLTNLSGLDIVRKMEKVGFLRGLVGYVRMFARVAAVMIRARAAKRQFLYKPEHS